MLFSMNTTVTATGMSVKAIAEDGLLIHNELDADNATYWQASTTASYASLVALAPASSANMTTWYHNRSNDPNNHAAVEAYEVLSSLNTDVARWERDAGDSKTGVYYVDKDNDQTKDAAEKAYVLLNKFYIKSSGDAIALASGNAYEHLYINKVKVTGSTNSVSLDKALRVAIVIGSNVYIYAPFATANVVYNVNGSTSTTAVAVTDTTNFIVNTTTGATSIPAYTAQMDNSGTNETLEADVYIYFEGEDPNCKSANVVATLDTLNVEVVFGITTVTAPVSP